MRHLKSTCILWLGLIVPAAAAPLDFKEVSQDAVWMAHVDADGMRESAVVRHAFGRFFGAKDLESIVVAMVGHLGIDPRKDLHGMTAYGSTFGERKAIMIVHARLDRSMLEARVKTLPGYVATVYKSYRLGSFVRRQQGSEQPVTAAFWKPDELVFGASVNDVQRALDVLDGGRPNMSDKPAALSAEVPAGAFFCAGESGLGDLPLIESPIVKQSDRFFLTVGEHDGETFASGRLVTKSTETAQSVRQVIEGVRSMLKLRNGHDAALAKLIDGVQVTVIEREVRVRFHAPAKEVAEYIDKIDPASFKK